MGSQLLQIKCSRGHETTAILQEQKFEILFDIGRSCDPGWILPRGGFILHLKA